MLLDVETEERATLVLDDEEDDEERLINGTLVEDVVDAACREKIGRVQRVLLLLDVDDHERYEPDDPEPGDEARGGQGSAAGLPGTAGAVSAGLPCGTQL